VSRPTSLSSPTQLHRPLRLATRASELALVQVDLVAAALAGGRATEVVSVQTAGDLRSDAPIRSIGGRGVFVTEVDEAVLGGRADVSVHSAKDVPSVLGEGLVIAAYLPRADARDALVGAPLSELAAGAVVASGSVRRRAQLAWLRPDLRFAELRGNIGTRLAKVPRGGAVVVAMAALVRLGLADRASHVFSTTEMLPQIGQGAIAICCRSDDAGVIARLGEIDDAATRAEVECERAWLRAVGGGCDSPVGAHARHVRGELRLEAVIASLDGHVLVREAMTGSDPEALGRSLAADILDRCGGRAVLEAGSDWAGAGGAALEQAGSDWAGAGAALEHGGPERGGSRS
jgi:hydroxymethylbilane synthase